MRPISNHHSSSRGCSSSRAPRRCFAWVCAIVPYPAAARRRAQAADPISSVGRRRAHHVIPTGKRVYGCGRRLRWPGRRGRVAIDLNGSSAASADGRADPLCTNGSLAASMPALSRSDARTSMRRLHGDCDTRLQSPRDGWLNSVDVRAPPIRCAPSTRGASSPRPQTPRSCRAGACWRLRAPARSTSAATFVVDGVRGRLRHAADDILKRLTHAFERCGRCASRRGHVPPVVRVDTPLAFGRRSEIARSQGGVPLENRLRRVRTTGTTMSPNRRAGPIAQRLDYLATTSGAGD